MPQMPQSLDGFESYENRQPIKTLALDGNKE
jgi:hypothetical protein